MIDAIYYDGVNSRRHPVTVVIQKRVVAMRGDVVRRHERLSKMDVSERLQYAPRILRFPDGAFIEASDHRRLDRMLKENRFEDPRVVRWQNNWPLSLLALVSLLVALLSIYQWGVPRAVEALVERLPPTLEKKMGDDGFAMMDGKELKPSALPEAVQQRLRARFAAMVQPRGERTAYRLEFRSGRMGPNAFALPNGVIVMTDALVQVAGNDEAVLGVLSHELGHVKRRHAARHVLQGVGVGLLLNVWVGDVSSALAAAPAILLNQKHSRDFEREADGYAIDMMLANGLPLEPMADWFVEMEALAQEARRNAEQGSEDDEEGEEGSPQGGEPLPDYLSSHPSDAERIGRLRDAGMRARVGAASR